MILLTRQNITQNDEDYINKNELNIQGQIDALNLD